jgi:hypothetical protein
MIEEGGDTGEEDERGLQQVCMGGLWSLKTYLAERRLEPTK